MFVLKKIISMILSPLTVSLVISFTGLLLLWFSKKTHTGKIVVSFGLVLIVLFGYGAVSDTMLGRLERQYEPYDQNLTVTILKSENQYPLQYVVVLGGGHTSAPGRPATAQLSNRSLIRLVDGILIYRKNPGSKLVLSGGSIRDRGTEAEIMSQVATQLGVDVQDIVLETRSKDTGDQAVYMESIVRNRPFVLVSSAYHLPRAMTLFRARGMNPIPAPSNYEVRRPMGTGLAVFFPNAHNIRKAELAVHEYLGTLWAMLSGQT